MTATVEHIKNEIGNLAPDEAEELFRELGRDFPELLRSSDEQADSVEAEWADEIEKRVKEIETGEVHPLTSEESDRRIDILFAKHGFPSRRA